MRRSLRLLLVLAVAAVAQLGLVYPAFAVTVERVVSPGGIEAWLVQDHSNPIIDFEISFKGGAAVEPAAKRGLANMVAGMLDEGAGQYDSQTFQGKLEDLGIQISFNATKDFFRGHLKTISDRQETAYELFQLSLTKPRFDKEPLERTRSQTLNALARQQQSPDSIAAIDWFRIQFAGHPYSTPVLGSAAAVKAITAQDLRGYTKAQLARSNIIVGVVGDITPERLRSVLDVLFGSLPANAQGVDIPAVRPDAPGRVQVIDRDMPQSVAMFGANGIKRDDPDWYAGYVMNYILGGGGFSSWLTEEVREKRGLAYSVYSYLQPYQHAGLIVGGVATENARLGESIQLIREVWARMRDTGPTEEQMNDAKTYLVGSFPLQMDSTTNIASLLVAMQEDKLGIDYLDRRAGLINGVTDEDVRRVSKRMLDPAALSFVVVGRPTGISSKP